MTISVVSYNIHALLSKLGVDPLTQVHHRFDKNVRPFSDLVTGLKPDVLLLQEINVVDITLTDVNFPYHLFPRYNVYFSKNFRVAILVADTLNCTFLDLSEGGLTHTYTYASCWIEIKVDRSVSYILGSVYRPDKCALPMFDPFWSECKQARERSQFVFISGDFNVEHQLWGADYDSRDGTVVATKLLELGLHPVVLPSPSCFPFDGSRPSYIDLTCTTSAGLARLSNWRYDFRLHVSSDHLPVTFDLAASDDDGQAPYQVWDLRNADWDRFARDLSCALDHWLNVTPLNTDPDRAARSWSETVVRVASQDIGKTVVQPGRARMWWHKGIRKLIAKKHRARKLAQRTRLPDHFLQSRAAKREVERAVAAAKESYWNFLVDKLNDGNDRDFCRLYRNVCSDRSRETPPLQSPDGVLCVSAREKADLLLRTFKAAAIGPGVDPHNRLVSLTADSIQPELSDEFPSSVEHIAALIKGLPVRKAFGVDDVHPMFLKCGGSLVTQSLHRLFHICWKAGVFPRIWKLGKVCPISKRAKPSPDPKSYRPIALLSIIGKLFEKILAAPLRNHLLSHGHISRYQSGFQPARNCEEQIIRLTEDILYQFEQRASVTAVFLDVSKAYDSVWRDGLRFKLANAGVRGNLYALLSSFLTLGPHVWSSTTPNLPGMTLSGVCHRVQGYLQLCSSCMLMTLLQSLSHSTSSTLRSSLTTSPYGLNPALATNNLSLTSNSRLLSVWLICGVGDGDCCSVSRNARLFNSLDATSSGQHLPLIVGAWSTQMRSAILVSGLTISSASLVMLLRYMARCVNVWQWLVLWSRNRSDSPCEGSLPSTPPAFAPVWSLLLLLGQVVLIFRRWNRSNSRACELPLALGGLPQLNLSKFGLAFSP